MTYDATVELLSRLLDGDLTPAERQKAEAMIAGDGGAREIYLGLRRVRGALGELAEAEPPGHLDAFIERRVALEAKRSRPRTSADRGLRRFLVEPSMLPAFAVLLALAAMIYLLAGGLHRFERAHEPRILRPPPASLRVPAPRQVGGRTFSFAGDRWIEAGLSAEQVAQAPRLLVRAEEVDAWIGARPELEGLAELGAAVIELDGEVVEVVFE